MKKILTAILLAAATLLTACAGQDTPAPSDTGAQNNSDTTAAETEPVDMSTVFELEAQNFEGRAFNVLGTQWYSGVSSPWSSPELHTTEITGDLLNDAVYNRNLKVEAAYNIKMEFVAGEPYLASVISGDYLAGANSYDAAFPRISEMGSIAGDGMAFSMTKVDYLDLTKKWWSQSARESLTIEGNTLFASGDISYMDKYTAAGFYFNKDVAAAHGITSDELYDLVDDGKWTYDAFLGYAKGITEDSNGDGKLNGSDTWGAAANQDYVSNVMHYWNNPYTMVVDGQLTFTANTERAVDIIDRMIGMLTDNIIFAASWDVASAPFTGGRSLFYLEVTQNMSNFRSMDSDFGILPPMKYDEAQESYRTTCAVLTTMVCIPKTAADKNFSAYMLEALAHESAGVTDAYIDIALESKYSRDERTANMLHIIFDGITYDIGYHTDIAGMSGLVNSMRDSRTNTVASKFAAIEEKANKKIAELNEAYKIAE